MVKWLMIGSLMLFGSVFCFAQKASLGGYVSGLYIPIVNFDDGSLTNNALIHNRLNFKYDFPPKWFFVAQVRNRALFGTSSPTTDSGWMNLSLDWVRNSSFVLTSSVERLNISYKTEKFNLTVGRQRINWSQTMSFNPNDIFNTYSLFDYDYPERSGSDAIRLSYYPSGTSVVELAAKLNRRGEVTAAILHRFNRKGMDIQYLAGIVNGLKLVVGGGFSSEINGVNIRGEFSDFYDTRLRQNTLSAAIGADYVFSNSLSLATELFYNQQRGTKGSIMELYNVPMSPERLSVTPWTITANVSYPFTPIFSGGFATMCFVNIPVFYFGPSADISLSDNVMLSAVAQIFAAGNNFIQPSGMGVGYVRLKYNF